MSTVPLPRPALAGAVVVGYDGRPPADAALAWAAGEASATRRPLVMVHVLTMTPMMAGPGLAGLATLTAPAVGDTVQRTTVQRAAAQVAERLPQLTVERLEVRGDPAVELADLSRGAHVLVVGSRGTGIARAVPSAQVGTRIVAQVTCPAVVVPTSHPGRIRRGVLAGISVRTSTPEVLDRAFSHADLHDLPLTVVHATQDTLRASDEDRRRWIGEAVSGHRARHPNVRVEIRLAAGRPARTLLGLAERMDLVVVGQHAAGSTNPLGHVRGSIVDRSPCPVMVVPPPTPGP
ncbi:hypothetical protein ASC64_06920 [Nocardioides sp. Root122]|uniref:universal stress protein n=1 Tax=Nocardioides TaxID=1839 RepID=UPI000702CEAC|nr:MULTISPECIES: universal stress protein [Nocardioides]KQV69572.1 hypothetical protein ASC64_06920 [Nocardioides sp. Root122]MCK9824502.1 universal stress protein [Nocardioides cavernae]